MRYDARCELEIVAAAFVSTKSEPGLQPLYNHEPAAIDDVDGKLQSVKIRALCAGSASARRAATRMITCHAEAGVETCEDTDAGHSVLTAIAGVLRAEADYCAARNGRRGAKHTQKTLPLCGGKSDALGRTHGACGSLPSGHPCPERTHAALRAGEIQAQIRTGLQTLCVAEVSLS